MAKIITISREYGSGGHVIGEKVAERLGIPFYDSLIITEAAEKTGIAEETVKKVSEDASAANKYINAGFAHRMNMVDRQDKVFNAQREIILEYAKQGPCVIVGRCSDIILEEAGIDCLNVFIHADIDYRVEKAKTEYGLEDCDEKLVRKVDKSRKYYYRYYADRGWGEYEYNQLILDSGKIGEDRCVDIIISAAE